MSLDWWWGVICGGLGATFIWGLALVVIIAAIGAGRHHTPMTGHTINHDPTEDDR